MRRITIKDVAERAGVSASTVSHVLNGKDEHVGPDKRKVVLDVVRELNYRPNAIARSMVTRSTFTVGLIISELDNPLFVPVTEGVGEVLRDRGYHIVLASATDIESEKEAIEILRAQQVDGIIIMSLSIQYDNEHLRKLKEEGFPFVVINRYMADNDVNQVHLDDRGAAYTATSHMLGLGHTRIGTISGPIYTEVPRYSALERQNGWQEALLEKGLPVCQDWVVVGDYTFEGGYKAARQLLAQLEGKPERPTALFIANESMAVGALKALFECGVRVPQDLAVITVGDAPFIAYTIPALTTLALPVVEAGRVAARILVHWLQNGKQQRAQRVTLSCNLRVRESCGTVRSEVLPFD